MASRDGWYGAAPRCCGGVLRQQEGKRGKADRQAPNPQTPCDAQLCPRDAACLPRPPPTHTHSPPPSSWPRQHARTHTHLSSFERVPHGRKDAVAAGRGGDVVRLAVCTHDGQAAGHGVDHRQLQSRLDPAGPTWACMCRGRTEGVWGLALAVIGACLSWGGGHQRGRRICGATLSRTQSFTFLHVCGA